MLYFIIGFFSFSHTLHAAKWEVFSLREKCGSAFPSQQCVGYYGFSITYEGNYFVGPGPNGEIIQGRIDPEEFAIFAPLAGRVAAIIRYIGMTAGPILPGWSEFETLSFFNGVQYSIYDWRGDGPVYFRGAPEDLFSLHNYVNTQLIGKYYPRPFPSDKN